MTSRHRAAAVNIEGDGPTVFANIKARGATAAQNGEQSPLPEFGWIPGNLRDLSKG